MSLYPTFEDLKVDGLLKGQSDALMSVKNVDPEAYKSFADYMGLDLNSFHYNDQGELVPGSAPAHAAPIQMPVAYPTQPSQPASQQQLAMQPQAASGSLVVSNARPGEIQHGIRKLILCKDAEGDAGKVGVSLASVDNGVFVSLVRKDSPAALAGLRFGDQLLSIRDKQLAGKSGSDAMKLIRKAPVNNIEVTVRDRPFERTIIVNKSSLGEIGLSISNGMIKNIHKDSSAARNGVLSNHYIVEVDGQNVVGLKDTEMKDLLSRLPGPVRLTILPALIFKRLVERLWKNQLRHDMDRSAPQV